MQSSVRHQLVLLAAIVGPFLASIANGGPTINWLGDLPGNDDDSRAYSVSADGSAVVGRSDGMGSTDPRFIEAFRWTDIDGMVGLGDLVTTSEGFSQANGISGDGTVVVGESQYDGTTSNKAFRWTLAGGMTEIPILSGGDFSFAFDVSDDGNKVVGRTKLSAAPDGDYIPVLWTYDGQAWSQAQVAVGWEGGPNNSAKEVRGISSDGQVLAGVGINPNTMQQEAFGWTTAGTIGLGVFPAQSPASLANAISADGGTIVGFANSGISNESEAFRWTFLEGINSLSNGIAEASRALSVSRDGLVIVGAAEFGQPGDRPFVWTTGTGMRNLSDIAVRAGLVSSSSGLSTAHGVSDDGTAIVGEGVGPTASPEAWLIRGLRLGRAVNWNANNHDVFKADVNSDGWDDLVARSRDDEGYSAVLVAAGTGEKFSVYQVFKNDHLGLPWATAAVASGNFSGCTDDGCDELCSDDLILQRQSSDPHALLYAAAGGDFFTVDQLFDNDSSGPNTYLGFPWAQDQARIHTFRDIVGGDDHDDLFVQPASPGGSSHLLLADNATGGFDSGSLVESFLDGFAGFNWSEDDAVLHFGDFSGDGRIDILIQAKPPFSGSSDDFGVVVSQSGGPPYLNATPYISWDQVFAGIDWSPEKYILHVGQFNLDQYYDVLFQPVNEGDPAHIVLFGDPVNVGSWIVETIPANEGGFDWSVNSGKFVVGNFAGDLLDDIYRQAYTGVGDDRNLIIEFANVGSSNNALTVNVVAQPNAPILDGYGAASLASPVAVMSSTVTVTGSGAPNQMVNFYVNGAIEGSETVPPSGSFSRVVTLDAGENTVVATMVENGSESGFSEPLYYDSQP